VRKCDIELYFSGYIIQDLGGAVISANDVKSHVQIVLIRKIIDWKLNRLRKQFVARRTFNIEITVN
jgi:hypothetical protein